MQIRQFLLLAGLCLASVSISDALPILPEARPLLVTAGDPADPRYAAMGRPGYLGIASLAVDRLDGSFACTGSLLSGGAFIVTAAHCVTDTSGTLTTFASQATFYDVNGVPQTIDGAGYLVSPDWTGDIRAGGDLALIRLAQRAPAGINGYTLYTSSNEAGQAVDLAGFGFSGTGATGITQNDGLLRHGYNTLDATMGQTLGTFNGWTGGDGVFLIDLDDGSPTHDALGRFFGKHNTGLGPEEAAPSLGDSGGPGFIGGKLAVITSFNTRLQTADGISSDVDDTLNSSTGELSGFTRLSAHEAWIRQATVPEPSSVALIALGLLGITTHRFFRNNRKTRL